MPHTNKQVASTVASIVVTILIAVAIIGSMELSGDIRMFWDFPSFIIALIFPALTLA